MAQIYRDRVVAVVVTYRPDLDVLGRVLDALCPQVRSTVLVDNSSGADLSQWLAGRQTNAVHILPLGTNLGVAAGHNAGIRWARERQAEFVLLMDQDSIPMPDMVDRLVAAVIERASAAVAGPRYLDERQNNPPPFIRVRGLRLERCGCDSEGAIVPVDYLISSGCLIPTAIIDHVGAMREDLFIDYVDIEWGWRLRRGGFQSLGVCGAHMQHSLGEEPIAMFNSKFPCRSALRHYYLFRNAVLVYKEPWVPLNWKLVDGWRLLLKYVFYSLFAKPRAAHWRSMSLGLWHGLRGKSGRFEAKA